jgi:acyl carrier protein
MQNIEQELRQFVVDNFLFGQANGHLSNSDSFLDKGIIDATGVLELVVFLEETYRIKIQDRELVPDNLDSINNLVRFLERKRQLTA